MPVLKVDNPFACVLLLCSDENLKKNKKQEAYSYQHEIEEVSLLQKLIKSRYSVTRVLFLSSSSVEAICHHLVRSSALPIFSLTVYCCCCSYYCCNSTKWQWGHFFLVKLPLQQLFVLVSPTTTNQMLQSFFVSQSFKMA